MNSSTISSRPPSPVACILRSFVDFSYDRTIHSVPPPDTIDWYCFAMSLSDKPSDMIGVVRYPTFDLDHHNHAVAHNTLYDAFSVPFIGFSRNVFKKFWCDNAG